MIPENVRAALDTLRIVLVSNEQIDKQTKIKLHRDLADLETKLLTVFLPGEDIKLLTVFLPGEDIKQTNQRMTR